MRIIEYQRWEFPNPEPEKRKADLLTFVYDIPNVDACGIFPPLHIINQILSKGGSDGGMSPGATWEGFEIERKEYEELVEGVRELDPKSLGENARFTWNKFEFDPSFDSHSEWMHWVFKVSAKHRDSFHEKIERYNKSH